MKMKENILYKDTTNVYVSLLQRTREKIAGRKENDDAHGPRNSDHVGKWPNLERILLPLLAQDRKGPLIRVRILRSDDE
jgi:hypothetical protein